MDVKSGWYPDPDGKPCERYWDGNGWTDQTRPIVSKVDLSAASKRKFPTHSDEDIKAKVEAQRQRDSESIKESWKELKIAIPLSLIMILVLYLFIQFAVNSSPEEAQPLLNKSTQETPTKIDAESTTPSRSENLNNENNASTSDKLFTTSEIAALNRVKMKLYNHAEVWSGYVVGNNTFAEVANSCQELSSAYDSIRSISSSGEDSEDLLDRAKDYTFEAYRSCNNAIKKQDLNELGESVSLAGSGVAFFDQVLSGNK